MMMVFDLGTVLASGTRNLPLVAKTLGISEEQLTEPYWRWRPEYDRGMDPAQYWELVSGVCGIKLSSDKIAEVEELDCKLWLEIRESARKILEDVNLAGVPVSILSNAPILFESLIDQTDWASLYQHRFISAHLQMAKPDEEIYLHVEKNLRC